MVRIVVAGPAPLLADGVAAALRGVAGWQVERDDGVDAATAADVCVLHARDAAQAAALAERGTQPLVLLGDDLREAARRAGTRPLALLSPDATPGRLRAAVAAVLEGLRVHEADVDTPMPARGALPPPDHEPLTPRELEVFELLGKGLSNPDIAGVLGISAHTAKYHVGQILAKVGAATRAEAVRSGLQLGLIGL